MVQEKNKVEENTRELAWLHGDAGDFTRIYSRYQPLLFGIARSYLDESTLASDMVQDVFLKLWNKRKDLKIDDLRSYLFRMTRNRCMDHHRSIKHADELEQAENVEASETANEEFEARETGHQLKDMIKALSPQCRTVFLLVRFEGLPYREVAEILNISEKTVENHMGRALKALRTGVKESDQGINSTLLFALFTAGFEIKANIFHIALGEKAF